MLVSFKLGLSKTQFQYVIQIFILFYINKYN